MAANTSEDELSPLMSSSAQGSRQQADGAQGSTQRKQGRGSSLSRAHSGPRVFRPMEAPEVCAALSLSRCVREGSGCKKGSERLCNPLNH